MKLHWNTSEEYFEVDRDGKRFLLTPLKDGKTEAVDWNGGIKTYRDFACALRDIEELFDSMESSECETCGRGEDVYWHKPEDPRYTEDVDAHPFRSETCEVCGGGPDFFKHHLTVKQGDDRQGHQFKPLT